MSLANSGLGPTSLTLSGFASRCRAGCIKSADSLSLLAPQLVLLLRASMYEQGSLALCQHVSLRSAAGQGTS